MSDTITGAGGFTAKHHFLIRRLHSLSGLIPIGVFLCIHLSLNACIMAGPEAFQYAVNLIHSLEHLGILKVVEVGFIFLPIAFHAVLGVLIWLTSQPNMLAYQYNGNVRYTLQRWTGIVTLLFILAHLWHMHWLGRPFNGGLFNPEAAPTSAVAAMSYGGWGWLFTVMYAVGVVCAVYHFANGVWTFLITWGITIGPRAQRGSGYVCAFLGIVLGVIGIGALCKIKSMNPQAVEQHQPVAGLHV